MNPKNLRTLDLKKLRENKEITKTSTQQEDNNALVVPIPESNNSLLQPVTRNDASVQTDVDVDVNLKIRNLESENNRLKKKMKILQQKIRRRSGKVKYLEDFVATLKDEGSFDILGEN